MRVHFDVLSKKPREEWVEVLVDETEPEGESVRVKLRELPDTEFEALEAMFSGRALDFRRVLRETDELERKFRAELPEGERWLARKMAQERMRKPFSLASEALREVRRELVSKAVVDHNPDDFEVGPVPNPTEAEAYQAVFSQLTELGLDEAQAELAMVQGVLKVPFRGVSWQYGEGSGARLLPGASADTVRFYEKSRAGSALLNSLSHAIIYWHRLTLKPVAVLREEARKERLERLKVKAKLTVLLKHGLIKPERVAEVEALKPEAFEVLNRVILDLGDLTKAKPAPTTESTTEGQQEPPGNP